jgi:hypothetical protein
LFSKIPHQKSSLSLFFPPLEGARHTAEKASPMDLEALAKIVVAQAEAGNLKEATLAFESLAKGITSDQGLARHKEILRTTEEHPDFLAAVRALAKSERRLVISLRH